jgi:hypothetical protein
LAEKIDVKNCLHNKDVRQHAAYLHNKDVRGEVQEDASEGFELRPRKLHAECCTCLYASLGKGAIMSSNESRGRHKVRHMI